MTFFRLLKPEWGKRTREIEGEQVPNPDFVREVVGKATIEGIFEDDFVAKKNSEGYNIYWFPNHPSQDVYSKEKSYLNGRDIDVFEYLFIDMDLKDGVYKSKEAFYEIVAEFPLKPTLTVDSGNGVHVYWQITDLTRDLYVIFQKRLIQHFQTDESIWTVLQIMRYPGSQNTKKEDEFKQTTENSDLSGSGPYSVEDFDAVLPEITPEGLQKAQSHLDKLDGKVTIDVSESVNIDELSDKFIDLMNKNNLVKQLFTDPISIKGDRSKADASLANHLFSNNFNRKEAIGVIANTMKGLSKGANRMEYAINTVALAYDDRLENRFKTVGEILKEGKPVIKGARVHGPVFMDCLEAGWRKGQFFGLIAGSGIGKTSLALKMILSMIQNNEEDDEIYVFFTLEMPQHEIIERWIKLVGQNSPLANKLYVIANEDEDGEPRNLTLQDLYFYCQDLIKDTGRPIKSIVIDHLGVINQVIDLRKNPTFGAEGDLESGGYGNKKTVSQSMLCKGIKQFAKMLDAFTVLLTQTTKAKGIGDLPIDKDGAFGVSAYENFADYIATAWQPLMRVYKETPLRVLAWQYAKIRNKSKEDKLTTHEQCLLTYDMDSGDLYPVSSEDFTEFQRLLPIANEARKSLEKKESNSYSRGPQVSDLKKLKLV
jgi:hypothetical protein